jgi:hypothetical protein
MIAFHEYSIKTDIEEGQVPTYQQLNGVTININKSLLSTTKGYNSSKSVHCYRCWLMVVQYYKANALASSPASIKYIAGASTRVDPHNQIHHHPFSLYLRWIITVIKIKTPCNECITLVVPSSGNSSKHHKNVYTSIYQQNHRCKGQVVRTSCTIAKALYE